MKKSIILIIFVLYLASIVVIGFFGITISAYKTQIYATDIELMNDEIQTSTVIGKYIELMYDPDGDEDVNVFFLKWRVLPEDTTNKNVDFIYNESKGLIEIDRFGIVKIKGRGAINVQIVCQTNPAINQTVRFIIR